MNEREIFISALQQEEVAQRQAFLDRACGADTVLRQRVQGLLRAFESAGSFLEQPADGAEIFPADGPARSQRDDAGSEGTQVGDVIGRYKLLQQIGEGGMGTVYMAEQTEPVRRKVALKVIKPGMDSRQIIARFEAERQALALMEHVNIARVLDAGTTEDNDERETINDEKSRDRGPDASFIVHRSSFQGAGRPYFVMELVHGVPITKYCDDNHLTPHQRLELFMPVCHAIQHAHQKGIIHRDIKPSNVMITLYDGKAVPKVIDFGVAKATEQRLTERTMFTEYGTMVGTLEYMSPEQAEMSALGVDTRSDIYSLGVLLYELLTGTTPLSHKRLREAAYSEVVRLIKEEEPPKPSTRLSNSGEALATISAQRQMEPTKLTKLMRGELDWIVMKALEKDRDRRYDSANGLAEDVARYLEDEPVLAGPPTARYRLRKFLRRNKAAVLAATLVIGALIAGMIGTTWGLIRAESKAAAEAKAKHEATEQAAIATAVNDFLQKDLLHQADSEEQAQQGFAADPNLTVKEALNRAGTRIGERFQDQPLLEAAIRQAIGNAYRGIGDPKSAVPHYERALELRNARRGPDHRDTLSTLNNLACVFQDSGQLNKALPLFEESVARRTEQLGPDHEDTLIAINNLAGTYRDLGQLDKAVPLFEQMLVKFTETLGPDHFRTLVSMSNLGHAYGFIGKKAEAVQLLEEALAKQKATLGPEHPHTLQSMNNLGNAYRNAEEFDKALPLCENTLAKTRERLGSDHPRTLAAMNNLATVYFQSGRAEKALPLFEQLLAMQTAKQGANHPSTLIGMNNLAFVYNAAGQHNRARSLFEQIWDAQKEKHGPDHADTLASQDLLAGTYLKAEQPEKAVTLLRDCLARREKTQPDVWQTLLTKAALGTALVGVKDFAEAERLLLQSYEGMKQLPEASPDNKARQTRIVERLVKLYESWDKPDQAEQWRKELPAKDPPSGDRKPEQN